MRPILTLALAAFATAHLIANDPEPPDPKAGKQNGPLKVRLVARKSSYVLDRQGMTAEKYREAARAGNLAPPAVDLVLELTNTSKEEVAVRISGAAPAFTFRLKGPKDSVVSSLDTKRARVQPKERKKVEMATIGPGKKYELRITTLDSTDISYPRAPAYWSEPGAHTLSVELRTGVREGGGGKSPIGKITTLSSQELKLTVQLK